MPRCLKTLAVNNLVSLWLDTALDDVLSSCCSASKVLCNCQCPCTLCLFKIYLHPWKRMEISDITYTITRMIDSKVCSQMAHFSLEHTHIVICSTIRGTHRLFIRRTIIHAHAPPVPGTKCLTNGKVLTGNIDARINICNTKTAKEFYAFSLFPSTYLSSKYVF